MYDPGGPQCIVAPKYQERNLPEVYYYLNRHFRAARPSPGPRLSPTIMAYDSFEGAHVCTQPVVPRCGQNVKRTPGHCMIPRRVSGGGFRSISVTASGLHALLSGVKAIKVPVLYSMFLQSLHRSHMEKWS